MYRFALLVLCIPLHLAGCTDEEPVTTSAAELRMNKRITDTAEAGTTREYPLLLAPADDREVTFDVVATARGDSTVRVRVYGPANDGDRVLLVEGGNAQPRRNVELNATSKVGGEHLIVVGSFQLETDTTYDLGAYCDGC